MSFLCEKSKNKSGKNCLFVVVYVNTILEFRIMLIKSIFKPVYKFSIYYILWQLIPNVYEKWTVLQHC